MFSTKLSGQILFHITRICLPKWGQGNFCKHSSYQSLHPHAAPIKNERTTRNAFLTLLPLQHLQTHTGAIYLSVYPRHESAANKTPSPFDNFPAVGQWFSPSLNQFSRWSSHSSRPPEARISPAVASHRKWTVSSITSVCSMDSWRHIMCDYRLTTNDLIGLKSAEAFIHILSILGFQFRLFDWSVISVCCHSEMGRRRTSWGFHSSSVDFYNINSLKEKAFVHSNVQQGMYIGKRCILVSTFYNTTNNILVNYGTWAMRCRSG